MKIMCNRKKLHTHTDTDTKIGPSSQHASLTLKKSPFFPSQHFVPFQAAFNLKLTCYIFRR